MFLVIELLPLLSIKSKLRITFLIIVEKIARGFKSRITFLRIVEKVAMGL